MLQLSLKVDLSFMTFSWELISEQLRNYNYYGTHCQIGLGNCYVAL